MSEFDLIRQLHERINGVDGSGPFACVVGIGDDAAVLDIPQDRQLVVTTDTLVEGVHFLTSSDAQNLGHKALAVNLSDLASMGAEPAWFFLALTLPSPDLAWLESFACGMGRLARSAGVVLAGGDTTAGPLSITVTAMGLVEPGKALTRDGAQPGDLVVVSGQLGDAALALEILKAGGIPGPISRAALECPEPRLRLGRQLQGLATSCIDISDGLAADLSHILEASAAGAEINIDLLPGSTSLTGLPVDQKRQLQICGGDDYELCFTIAMNRREELGGIARDCDCPLTVIGKINASGELVFTMADGTVYVPQASGYDHFPGKGNLAGNQ
ncbi:MAG: thiamine-phosphate kinase [Xanthomonadales bacterium]